MSYDCFGVALPPTILSQVPSAHTPGVGLIVSFRRAGARAGDGGAIVLAGFDDAVALLEFVGRLRSGRRLLSDRSCGQTGQSRAERGGEDCSGTRVHRSNSYDGDGNLIVTASCILNTKGNTGRAWLS